jgi:hypothetical protein
MLNSVLDVGDGLFPLPKQVDTRRALVTWSNSLCHEVIKVFQSVSQVPPAALHLVATTCPTPFRQQLPTLRKIEQLLMAPSVLSTLIDYGSYVVISYTN